MCPLLTALLFLSIISGSQAGNPWLVPCFNGNCTAETAFNAMTITGPKEAISDLSEASDWIVFDCDPKATKQEIRVICKGPEASLGCKNLDEGGGPVNKLVRLPPHCGDAPFARISKSWVHENQSIPAEVAAQLALKETLKVRGLAFDDDFGAIPTPPVPIKFAFASATHSNDSKPETGASKRQYADYEWGGMSFELVNMFANVFNKKVTEKIDQKVEFNAPIKCSENDVVLLAPDFMCGIGKGNKVSGDFKATASGEIDLMFGAVAAVVGTLVPPHVEDFKMFGTLNGHVSGSIKLAGKVKGTLDSNDILIVDLPFVVPGIPNLISFGPKFQLFIRLHGKFEVALEQVIGFNYKIDEVRMFFPQTEQNRNSGSVEAIESPMTLKLDGQNRVFMEASAHIMPRLAIGVTVAQSARADLFAELDFSGTAGLDFGQLPLSEDDDSDDDNPDNGDSAPDKETPGEAGEDDPREGPDALVPRSFPVEMTQAGMDGCAYVTFSVNANIGCSASFFRVFGSASHYDLPFLPRLSYELVRVCTSDSKTKELTMVDPEPPRFSADGQERDSNARRRAILSQPPDAPPPDASVLPELGVTCDAAFNPGDLIMAFNGMVRPREIRLSTT